MYETKNATITPAMLRENAKEMAKKDWQQFFFSMCFYAGVMFDLSKLDANNLQNSLSMIMVCIYYFDLIIFSSDIYERRTILQKQLEQIEYPGLRRVYVEFAKHAFGSPSRTHGAATQGGKSKVVHAAQSKPFYDQINDIINEEIAKLKEPKPNLVSWLKKKDIQKALQDVANTPDISSIKDRFERTGAKYPDVHFDYFDS